MESDLPVSQKGEYWVNCKLHKRYDVGDDGLLSCFVLCVFSSCENFFSQYNLKIFNASQFA